jgi:predicted membrane protein
MTPDVRPSEQSSRTHWLSLFIGLFIMLTGTFYPPLLTNRSGEVDHTLLMLFFWSMSAGFVNGVGFIPRFPIFKMLFSGWACLGALAASVLIKFSY